VQIAFKDFIAREGILNSPWSDPLFKNFTKFLTDYNFFRVMRNTLLLSIYSLVAGFPLPIIFALSLNYVRHEKFKKTITYAPYFISTVVVVGIILQLFATRTGLVNHLLVSMNLHEVNFLGSASAFPHLYVWTQVWQTLGFNSIIYIATLSGIDPSLHEAAVVDGANKIQRMIHIDLPGIMPTAIVLLILNSGQILNMGFEKVLLMQNSLNMETSEIISTYVYKLGFKSALPQYSYSTAVGLFQSIIGLLLLVTVNQISKKVSKSSLF
jgi:multiple sugar transport system permease protein/putative aldouronate transport system permease protein